MTTEIDAEGLLPCPFCGTQPDLRGSDIVCPNIECWGPALLHMDHAEDAIAAWNRRASRSTSEAEPVAGCACQKCGRVYIGDLLVPDDVWAKISPVPVDGDKGGGLLCATCIVDGIVSAGLATAVYTHPTPASDDQVEAVTDEMVEAALKAWFADEINYLDDGSEADMAGWKRDMRAALLAAMGSTKK